MVCCVQREETKAKGNPVQDSSATGLEAQRPQVLQKTSHRSCRRPVTGPWLRGRQSQRRTQSQQVPRPRPDPGVCTPGPHSAQMGNLGRWQEPLALGQNPQRPVACR